MYDIEARVGQPRACYAMKREIAALPVTSVEYVRSSGG